MEGGYVVRVISLISLDIVLGAIVSSCVFLHLGGIDPDWRVVSSLGLTVWIIYTADHLMDIRKLLKPASTDRHLFFQQHATAIVRVLALAIFADGVLVLLLPVSVVKAGGVLGVLALVYLFVQHRLNGLKELSGALLFSAGVWLPVATMRSGPPQVVDYFVLVMFFLTALINLLQFSRHDEEQDRADGRVSAATQLGRKNLDGLIRMFRVIQLVVGITALYNYSKYPELWVVLAMNLLLLSSDICAAFLERVRLYRFLADAAFWLPGSIFLLLTD